MSVTLIRDLDHILTMEPGRPVFGPGDVWIDGARISAIHAPGETGRPGPDRADRVIDGTGKVALPGLVNTHHHFFQTLTRNVPIAQEAELFEWLVRHYPIWRGITGDMVDASARSAMGELLLSGCTTTTDHHYLFPAGAPKDLIDRQVRAAAELGIRFHPTRGSMEMGASRGGLPPDDVVETLEDVTRDYARVIDAFHDPSPLSMCRVALAPCAPFNVSEALMTETASIARRHGLRLHTHLGETRDEIDYCLEHFGCRPYAYARRLGWTEGDVWFAHAVTFDEDEIADMGRRGVGVAHCPSSNLRLGSGVAPIRAMLEAGVPVGLGVDGSASNDSSNMLGEVRQGLLVHRLGARASWLRAEDVLRIATTGGAAVLGRDDVGMLRAGLAADVVLVDFDQVCYSGTKHDPLAALVFNQSLRPVHTTIVNGRVVVSEGRLLTADEHTIARHMHTLSDELFHRVRAE